MMKDEFIEIYKRYIKREGSKELLDYLLSSKSDFFTAPASTRYHLSKEGGLIEHSLNVYKCLKAYIDRPRVKDVYKLQATDETIAIIALLHDICKVNVYKKSMRNKKDSTGKWIQVPSYEYQDELPYGHGEKSVYIISGFMKLSREEAFAIRYHMGFSNTDDIRNVGEAFARFPLAFALSTADMEATYFLEE
ncbi:HD domain-containing protein [Candidatus Izemoplasma sp. B36]|uniref:HD domain-containing protein n=1 Tax=Candidatus Izemoplasma sp. B36 TaxID=3242468 RepID=UPI003556003B